MEVTRCPACDALFDTGGGPARCPACGAQFDAPPAGPAADYIIDVTARADDGQPVGDPRTDAIAPYAPPQDQQPRGDDPFFEQRRFTGRVWPGGPTINGRTIIFRSGGTGPQDGTGCCACGCLILAVMGLIFLRGCATFFH